MRKFGGASGPGALSALNSLNNLVMPDFVISILSMSVAGSPSNLGILVVSPKILSKLLVEDCVYCLNAVGYEGETPHLNLRCAFM